MSRVKIIVLSVCSAFSVASCTSLSERPDSLRQTQSAPYRSVEPEAMYRLGRYYQGQTRYVEAVLATGKTKACIAGWVDVMGSHHDVFLYLAEKKQRGNASEHSAVQLQKLYQLKYGTVND